MFKQRDQIRRSVDKVCDLGFDNLIVSGCSFTYNNSEEYACTWPYYLKDLAGFNRVLDCSLPGAGNYHIAHSLKWSIEIGQPDPAKSLIVVMWSSNNRDDYICPVTNINSYPMRFNYSTDVLSAITGGNHSTAGGNTQEKINLVKNHESRAIENYLYIVGLYHYLIAKKYRFVFLDYINRKDNIPLANDFDIKSYLPINLQTNLKLIMTECTDLYKWAAGHNDLDKDQFHPNPDSHLSWTREILLPIVKSIK